MILVQPAYFFRFPKTPRIRSHSGLSTLAPDVVEGPVHHNRPTRQKRPELVPEPSGPHKTTGPAGQKSPRGAQKRPRTIPVVVGQDTYRCKQSLPWLRRSGSFGEVEKFSRWEAPWKQHLPSIFVFSRSQIKKPALKTRTFLQQSPPEGPKITTSPLLDSSTTLSCWRFTFSFLKSFQTY